jgi:hypothetical protein
MIKADMGGKHVGMATILGILILLFPLMCREIQEKPPLTLFDFSRPDDLKDWNIISDRLQGGNSWGELRPSPHHTVLFSGILQGEDSGSFCMVYSTRKQLQLRAFSGLLLRLKGDGKHYKLRIYTRSNIEGVSYQAGFNTRKNRLITVFLPFNSFIPFLGRRVVRNWPVLDQSSITHLGIMISDQVPGAFHLEIYWIKAKSH